MSSAEVVQQPPLYGIRGRGDCLHPIRRTSNHRLHKLWYDLHSPWLCLTGKSPEFLVGENSSNSMSTVVWTRTPRPDNAPPRPVLVRRGDSELSEPTIPMSVNAIRNTPYTPEPSCRAASIRWFPQTFPKIWLSVEQSVFLDWQGCLLSRIRWKW